MKRLLLIVAAAILPACKAPAPPPPQAFSFRVLSAPSAPVSGAEVKIRDRVLATTGADGVAPFFLDGRDGERVDVSVTCPAGYESPVRPVSVAIGRLASTDKAPQYDVACPPTTRAVVVAVNGSKGRRLAIRQLGQEIGRTDSSGVATLFLPASPQSQIDLTLDTSDSESADLRPQNPTATFLVRDRDEVFVFDPHFTVAKKRTTSRPAGRPTRSNGPPMPIRIQ